MIGLHESTPPHLIAPLVHTIRTTAGEDHLSSASYFGADRKKLAKVLGNFAKNLGEWCFREEK
jgi:hypothetical protein